MTENCFLKSTRIQIPRFVFPEATNLTKFGPINAWNTDQAVGRAITTEIHN